MKLATLLILVLFTINGSASEPSLQNFVDEAQQKFPTSQVLLTSEITAIFSTVLQGEAEQMFQSVLSHWEHNQAHNPYLQANSLQSPSLTKGLRCLYVNVKLALAADDPTNAQQGLIYQFLAAPKIAYKTERYSYNDLEIVFLPILMTTSQGLFKQGMSILLDPSSGTPKHKGNALIDAYRCLYGKCTYALTLSDPDKFQQEALFKLFAFPTHKRLITEKNQPLAERNKMSPCADCLKRAASELPLYPFEVFENPSSSTSRI